MRCPKCNKENPTGAVFCSGCGARFGTSSTMAPSSSSASYSSGTKIVQQSSFQGQGILSREILIGRSSNCDVVIDDIGVSSKHAKLFVENNIVYIEDLRSLNGTFVNGKKIINKSPVKTNDRIYLGSCELNKENPVVRQYFSMFGGSQLTYDAGTLQMKLNTNWLGKIFFGLMIILFFLPWLTIRSAGQSVSFTAFDFAFNRFPPELQILKGINADYGPLHTLYLIIFIALIAAFAMNFFSLKISDKFNYVNILSVILVVLVIVYLSLISSLDSLVGLASVVMQHNFAPYFFLFICLISIFEGYLEHYIGERRQ
ncbi:MAG: FHA domain-containing protein [Ignavibacteriae bacterium]|nr:MAG: FHA domain-containing protein [Ignavibacteriota bacterium]